MGAVAAFSIPGTKGDAVISKQTFEHAAQSVLTLAYRVHGERDHAEGFGDCTDAICVEARSVVRMYESSAAKL
jgi:hypothetical protein